MLISICLILGCAFGNISSVALWALIITAPCDVGIIYGIINK